MNGVVYDLHQYVQPSSIAFSAANRESLELRERNTVCTECTEWVCLPAERRGQLTGGRGIPLTSPISKG